MDIMQNLQNMLEESHVGEALDGLQSSRTLDGLAGIFGGSGGAPDGNPLGALAGVFGGSGTASGGNPLEAIGKMLGASGVFGGKSSSAILGTAALGGLLGALMTSKTARSVAGGALLAGGGAMLWDKYKQRVQQANTKGDADFGNYPSSTRERAERILRALIYAVKSDGHIDDKESAALREQLARLNLGDDGANIVKAALDEPLDPQVLAKDVKTADEALEVYTVSCAVIAGTSFMERSYLDALAKALGIPDDVKRSIESKAHGTAQGTDVEAG